MPRMSWKPKSCTSRTKCRKNPNNNDEKRPSKSQDHPKTIHLGAIMSKDVKRIQDWCKMMEPYGIKSSPEDMETQWNATRFIPKHTTVIDTACLCLSQGPLEHTIHSVMYHELLFNINNCLPVPHTSWDCPRSWQAFHSTHYLWIIFWLFLMNYELCMPLYMPRASRRTKDSTEPALQRSITIQAETWPGKGRKRCRSW